MKVRIRISKKLYEAVLTDLRRPHLFAAERVGFLSAHLGRVSESEMVILLTAYISVPDDLYIEDYTVGARINSEAIRRAMQTVLDTGQSLYHVHLHDWTGSPGLSLTDQSEIPPIVKSLHNVGGASIPHGLIVFSRNKAYALTSFSKEEEMVSARRISVVGHPFSFLESEL